MMIKCSGRAVISMLQEAFTSLRCVISRVLTWVKNIVLHVFFYIVLPQTKLFLGSKDSNVSTPQFRSQIIWASSFR